MIGAAAPEAATATAPHRTRLLLARPVVWLVALALLRGAIYAVVLPAWDYNDEEQHFHYVQYLAETRQLPQMGKTSLSPTVLTSISDAQRWEHFHLRRPPIVAPAEMGLEGYSYEAYQPPLYYALLVLPYSLLPGDTLTRLYELRFFTVALFAIVVVLAYELFRRLFIERPALALGGAVLLVLIPEQTMVGSRVNNDLLPELLGLLVLLVLVTSWHRPVTPRMPLLVGALLGLAILAKVSGSALVLLALAAFAWQACRRRCLSYFLVNSTLALVAMLAIAGWFLVRNILLDGEPSGSAAFLKLVRFVPRYTLPSMLLELTRGFWLTRWTGVYPWLFAAFMFAVGLLAAVGLAKRAARTERTGRPQPDGELVLLLLAACLLALVPLWWGVRTGLVQFIEGRFVAMAYPPAIALLLMGLSAVLPTDLCRRAVLGLIVVFAVVDAAYLGLFALPYYYFDLGFDFFVHKPEFLGVPAVVALGVGYGATLPPLLLEFGRQSLRNPRWPHAEWSGRQTPDSNPRLRGTEAR